MKKEQIVSISTNETLCENGDALLILVYKSEQEISMTSLENLKFNLTRTVQSWEMHFQKDCQIASENAEVISYTNTARNIG